LFLDIDDHSLNFLNKQCIMPEGSILSPLLYLIYENGIPNSCRVNKLTSSLVLYRLQNLSHTLIKATNVIKYLTNMYSNHYYLDHASLRNIFPAHLIKCSYSFMMSQTHRKLDGLIFCMKLGARLILPIDYQCALFPKYGTTSFIHYLRIWLVQNSSK